MDVFSDLNDSTCKHSHVNAASVSRFVCTPAAPAQVSALLKGLLSFIRSLYSQVNELAAKSKIFQVIKRGFLILVLEKNLNVFSIYQVNLFLNPQSFFYLPGKSLVLKLTGVCRRHFFLIYSLL